MLFVGLEIGQQKLMLRTLELWVYIEERDRKFNSMWKPNNTSTNMKETISMWKPKSTLINMKRTNQLKLIIWKSTSQNTRLPLSDSYKTGKWIQTRIETRITEKFLNSSDIRFQN